MIDCKSKYYRVHLKGTDRDVYDMILNGLKAYKKEIEIKQEVIKKLNYKLEDLVNFVDMDNPGLFYVNFYRYMFKMNNLRQIICFDFLYEIPEIDSMEKRMLKKLNAIKAHCPNGSAYEKELFLHDFLAKHVNYEKKDSDYHKAHSSVGAIVYHRAVCEGFAKAFKLLCNMMDISNIVVYGDAIHPDDNSKGRHAWNIVKIDDKCYQVDTTWDSGIQFNGLIKHTYFNITDQDISKNHEWERNRAPKCDSDRDNYFVRKHLLFRTEREAEKYICEEVKKGATGIDFKMDVQKFTNEDLVRITRKAMQSAFMGRAGYSYQYLVDEEFKIANLEIKVASK